MPKHTQKGKPGSRKRFKADYSCQVNEVLVAQSEKYEGMFQKESDMEDSCVSFKKSPFSHCVLKNVLGSQFSSDLLEQLQSLDLVEKNNDLYKFRQSRELKDENLPALKSFRAMLLDQLKPIISKMSGVALDDRLALFYGQYERTDYLLCHDDELEGRRIAFIFYFLPTWAEDDGGCLELFDTDEGGNPSCVKRRIVPTDNSLVFFEVSPVSFHQVSEVLTHKTRLSLGGWFHGSNIVRPKRACPPVDQGSSYIDFSEEGFYSLVNPVYLNPETQGEIQEKFEESSEISLPDFFLSSKFDKAAENLKTTSGWLEDGPADRRRVSSLSDCTGLDASISEMFDFMTSEPFFLLLSNLTGLRLHPLAPEDSDEEDKESEESSEISPKWKGKIRRWSQGHYTLIRDDDLGQKEFALDARICFNVSNWSSNIGGQTVYIARGEDEELITIEPENNSLNLVYRDRESLRFVKYVNSLMNQSGEFHDFDFSYYE